MRPYDTYTVMQQQKIRDPPTSTTKKRKGPRAYPERITQLQCLDNNSQLQIFFIQALNQSFKYLPGILSKIYNQIQLIVSLAEYRLTIAVDRPHPGDLLQNIKFKQQCMSTKIKILYLILSVILPYIKRKVYGVVVQNPTGWKQKILKFLTYVDKIVMTLNLINFCIFIRYGKYRSLTQRILKIPMQFINGQSARVLDFTLMNRKLIWGVYQLFLRTIIPSTYQLFGSTLKNIFYLNSYLEVESDQFNKCVFCQDRVKMPMKADCGHVACYYCYSTSSSSAQSADDRVQESCRSCGKGIKKWEKLFAK